MSSPEPASLRRSIVARVVAPLALLAAIALVIVVVVSSLAEEEEPSRGGGNRAAERTNGGDEGNGDANGGGSRPKTYAVEPGDSLSSIADRFGVSVEKLEQLNPRLDPQALSPGQEVKLR